MATMLRPSVLVPVILAMAVLGSFANSNRIDDVVVMMGFGIVGYILRAGGWPRPPLLLGVVLGPLAENFLWTSFQVYGVGFLVRPGALTLMVVLAIIIVYPFLMRRWSGSSNRRDSKEAK